MGWNLDITSDRLIGEGEVKEIVNSLYPNAIEETWGWRGPVDISRPYGAVLVLSGAYAMGDSVMAVKEAGIMAQELRARGHEVEVGDPHGE